MAERKSVAVDIEELHAKSAIKQISVDDLKVDRSYQRDPSQQLVDSIANNWDEISSELLLVSDRGEDENWQGRFYIVNGQHRSLAARKVGRKKVWARIIDLTDTEDPARVEATFRLRTNVRMSDKPLERFKAQVRAGDEESLAIVKVLERFDTQINETPNLAEGINAVSAIEKLYRIDNGGVLTEALEVIRDAFGYVGGAFTTQPILNSVAWFVLKHSDESDRGRLIEKLADTGPKTLDRKARTIQSILGGSLWLAYYRGILEIYNERLQTRQLEQKTKGSNAWKSRDRG